MFTERAKIIDRGSICSTPECTGSKLQCEPFPFSVACSRPSYPFWEKLRDEGKCRSQKKLKSLIEVPYVVHVKVQVLSFNMNLIFSP